MSKEASFSKYISIGKITKPHGLKGFLKFFLFNAESDILSDFSSLKIKKDTKSVDLKIEKLDLSSLLIKFFDINNRNQAEKCRDYEILILRNKLKKEKDDLYFVDLIGCDLYFEDNQIGLISDVVSYSGNDLLKVIDGEQKEHLIPIRKKLVKFFDIEGHKLIMQTIEGILDI